MEAEATEEVMAEGGITEEADIVEAEVMAVDMGGGMVTAEVMAAGMDAVDMVAGMAEEGMGIDGMATMDGVVTIITTMAQAMATAIGVIGGTLTFTVHPIYIITIILPIIILILLIIIVPLRQLFILEMTPIIRVMIRRKDIPIQLISKELLLLQHLPLQHLSLQQLPL